MTLSLQVQGAPTFTSGVPVGSLYTSFSFVPDTWCVGGAGRTRSIIPRTDACAHTCASFVLTGWDAPTAVRRTPCQDVIDPDLHQ